MTSWIVFNLVTQCTFTGSTIFKGKIGLGWSYILGRTFARNAIRLNHEQFLNLAWTAHGIKIWDGPGSLCYHRDGAGKPVPAMANIEILFDVGNFHNLIDELINVPVNQFESAICVQRDSRRVPLKPVPLSDQEEKHMSQHFDGLEHFFPYDIYEHNISCSEGLLRSFRECQLIDGFGLVKTPRNNHYSMLLVDITIYWQLFRILYNYSGLAPIRHDLFLCLGFWHSYLHSHKLVWAEFRSAFLASAFFSVFPTQTLLMQPKLQHSETFLTWLRLSYNNFRDYLLVSLQQSKERLITYLQGFANDLRNSIIKDYDVR